MGKRVFGFVLFLIGWESDASIANRPITKSSKATHQHSNENRPELPQIFWVDTQWKFQPVGDIGYINFVSWWELLLGEFEFSFFEYACVTKNTYIIYSQGLKYNVTFTSTYRYATPQNLNPGAKNSEEHLPIPPSPPPPPPPPYPTPSWKDGQLRNLSIQIMFKYR